MCVVLCIYVVSPVRSKLVINYDFDSNCATLSTAEFNFGLLHKQFKQFHDWVIGLESKHRLMQFKLTTYTTPSTSTASPYSASK